MNNQLTLLGLFLLLRFVESQAHVKVVTDVFDRVWNKNFKNSLLATRRIAKPTLVPRNIDNTSVTPETFVTSTTAKLITSTTATTEIPITTKTIISTTTSSVLSTSTTAIPTSHPPINVPNNEVNINTLMALIILILIALWLMSGGYLIIYSLRRRSSDAIVFSEDVILLAPIPIIQNETYYLHERIAQLEYDISFEVDKSFVEFGDFIAGGHFGEVYEGTLSSVFAKKKISVAIKIAGNATTTEDLELRKKLLEDELKIMCCVGSHPNIVTLIGAVTQNTVEGTWILMEKCSTGNLLHFLKSRRNTFLPQFEKSLQGTNVSYISTHPSNAKLYKQLDRNGNWKPDLSKDITTAHLLSFAMQIAHGMDYLSTMKCVHRDLAARNILLVTEGTVKIADFGLAKSIGYTDYYRSQSNQELPCRWMSVESLQHLKFSVESDIWSYGILLYELFSLGSVPYPNVSNEEIFEAISHGCRNDQPNYCPDAIYNHMILCWDFKKDRRPSFNKSAQLMKNHLFQASEEVLKKTTEDFRIALERQRLFNFKKCVKTKKCIKRMNNIYCVLEFSCLLVKTEEPPIGKFEIKKHQTFKFQQVLTEIHLSKPAVSGKLFSNIIYFEKN